MKKLHLLLLILTLSASAAHAQTFWVENFESDSLSGLSVSGYTGPNGKWSLAITGQEGCCPNTWYVSCAEAGHVAGQCQSGKCGGTVDLGASLHVAPNGTDAFANGDDGANYDEEQDLCGITCGSDRRAESPTIDCSGRTGISIHFYYICGSVSCSNNFVQGSVWYSADNGRYWSLLDTPAATTTCSANKSAWASYSIVLPASADNNPAVKLGFLWTNTDDASEFINCGSSVSFAIDSLSLSAQYSTGVNSLTINKQSGTYWVAQQDNNITLYSAQPVSDAQTIQVYDLTGRIMISSKWTSGQSMQQLDGSSLIPGMYIIKITGNNNISTQLKLLKQ